MGKVVFVARDGVRVNLGVVVVLYVEPSLLEAEREPPVSGEQIYQVYLWVGHKKQKTVYLVIC